MTAAKPAQGVWWCNSHTREATHTNKRGERCCDPKLGGILLPCNAILVVRSRGLPFSGCHSKLPAQPTAVAALCRVGVARADAEATDQEMIAIIATADAKRHDCCRCDAPSTLFKYKAFFCSEECAERVSDNTLDDGQTCVPAYLHSLDAMHEAEQTLSDEEYGKFSDILRQSRDDGGFGPWPERSYLSATARQRAQAFVRTIAARAKREARRAGA